MWRLLIIFRQNMAKFAKKEIPKRLFVALGTWLSFLSPLATKKTLLGFVSYLGFFVYLLGFGIWNTNTEARKRQRDRRGNDILDDQFCYSLDFVSISILRERLVQFRICIEDFWLVFWFLYQSGSVGKHWEREGGRRRWQAVNWTMELRVHCHVDDDLRSRNW